MIWGVSLPVSSLVQLPVLSPIPLLYTRGFFSQFLYFQCCMRIRWVLRQCFLRFEIRLEFFCTLNGSDTCCIFCFGSFLRRTQFKLRMSMHRVVFKQQSTDVFVTLSGTPVQGCISPFILNIYIRVVFKQQYNLQRFSLPTPAQKCKGVYPHLS